MNALRGELNTLMNKQIHNKFRKGQIRYEIQKRKEQLLSKDRKEFSGYRFPKLTNQEIELVKDQIRIHLKQERSKDRINSIIMFAFATLIVLFFMAMYANEIEQRVNFTNLL